MYMYVPAGETNIRIMVSIHRRRFLHVMTLDIRETRAPMQLTCHLHFIESHSLGATTIQYVNGASGWFQLRAFRANRFLFVCSAHPRWNS